MIRNPKDFWSGLLFAAFGLAAIVIAANYPLGTAARMGPGYFPRLLGLLLVALGAALVLRGVRSKGPALPGWQWRPLLVVLGSVVVFAIIVTRVGLLLSTVALIFAASTASREFRPREALLSGVLLAVLVVAVFVVGLKLQLPVWPAIS
jgi:hypothetical protein